MLEEMGIDYQVRPVDFSKRFEDPEFMAASLTGSMPAICDGRSG
jgi:glutathione S-transferase